MRIFAIFSNDYSFQLKFLFFTVLASGVASGVDILLCTLIIISIFTVNKAQFISNDCIGLMINDPTVVISTNETHTYSSLWNIRGYFGISYRKQRVKAMIFLLLLCSDIETCPGPSNCCNCQKVIRRNQSNISCNECERKFHLKCFDESDGVDVCSECYESKMAAPGKNTQFGESMSDDSRPVLEELFNLVSSKGIKLLHQNICGLATKYSHIEFILKNYKDIHMFTLSETHLHKENIQLLPSIPGYSLVYRNRTNGNFGGVAAFIADRVQWLRRHDLESPNLECLWIEVLLQNTKSFLIGLSIGLQMAQSFYQKTSLPILMIC